MAYKDPDAERAANRTYREADKAKLEAFRVDSWARQPTDQGRCNLSDLARALAAKGIWKTS